MFDNELHRYRLDEGKGNGLHTFQRGKPSCYYFVLIMSERQVSNLRPHAPKARALPTAPLSDVSPSIIVQKLHKAKMCRGRESNPHDIAITGF